jgi:hypothetical protein
MSFNAVNESSTLAKILKRPKKSVYHHDTSYGTTYPIGPEELTHRIIIRMRIRIGIRMEVMVSYYLECNRV